MTEGKDFTFDFIANFKTNFDKKEVCASQKNKLK